MEVWKSCKFSDEITSGNLDVSKFAVELHNILDGDADKSYLDPKSFLDNTYLTESMKIILKDSLLRLKDGKGQPVHVLDTSFGGGKTHSLVLLYHIFKNKDLGTKYISSYDFKKQFNIESVPDASMVCIDCRRITKKTLWGEIANSLKKYDAFKKFDDDKIPPQNIADIKALFEKPTLLMIDELPHYLLAASATKVGDTNLSTLTIKFLIDLISAVSGTKNSRLLLTLTGSQQLYAKFVDEINQKIKATGVERQSGKLKEALSRQVKFLAPVTDKDIYNVITKRLVKEINKTERDQTVKQYFDYYSQKDLCDVNYKTKMTSAYPFHPFLIDTLYERVSSIDEFNKTRGMLRLLASILASVYKKKEKCDLVGTSEVDLSNSEILEDLTTKINRDFREVISSDCIRKAQELDASVNVKLAEKISRTTYLYSLINATKASGITPLALKCAVCKPGIDPSLVDKTLEVIENEFWYIQHLRNEYFFQKKPNLNKVINQYFRDVSAKQIKEKIHKTLSGNDIFPSKVGYLPAIWDENYLNEDDRIRIFVLDYDQIVDDEETAIKKFDQLLTENSTGGIREKQNTIVMLYADKNGIESLKQRARMLIAVEETKQDDTVQQDKNNLQIINSRLETAKADLKNEIVNVYSKIVYPDLPNSRLDQISPLDSRYHTITEMIDELLLKKGKLIRNLNYEALNIKEKPVLVKDIFTKFKVDKGQKFIADAGVVMTAVEDGRNAKKLGYTSNLTEKDGKYETEISSVSWDGYAIPENLIYTGDTKPKVEQPGGTLFPEEPSNYNYSIECSTIEEMVELLSKLQVIQMNNPKLSKSLTATLRSDDTTITIQSGLKKQAEIKSFLQSQQSRFSGGGKLTISSDSDLQNDFKKYEINADTDNETNQSHID